MHWDKKSIEALQALFSKKYMEMRRESKTDRRNFSARWNKYLKGYEGEILYNFQSRGTKVHVMFSLANLMDLVNYRNEVVSDSLIIKNPDRDGQYIIVPRGMAARIMVLGML